MDYIILHFKDIGDTKCNLIDTESLDFHSKIAKAKIFYKYAIQKGRKALSDQVVLIPTDAKQSQAKAEDIIFETESGEHYRIKKSTFYLKYKLQNTEDIEHFDAGEYVILETKVSTENYVYAIQFQKTPL